MRLSVRPTRRSQDVVELVTKRDEGALRDVKLAWSGCRRWVEFVLQAWFAWGFRGSSDEGGRDDGVTSWVKISFPPLNNSDGDVAGPGYYALLTRKNRRGENGRRFA